MNSNSTTTATFQVRNGYSRSKTPEYLTVRNPVSLAEMVDHCTQHEHIWVLDLQNNARQVKITGRVRTWKRDASRIEVPYKYGLYEYGVFDASDIGRILIPVTEARP